MGAGERVDAVDLDEAEFVKHAVQIIISPGAGSRAQQQVPVQKQAASTLIAQQ
ncbi:hypothetical protein [Tropicimonas sp. IMCC6043]|uniref:hypothetical protein n=1 Tax=Tropicimonas sp. IMCC6043 TaxID=2510645 RepID=UPI00352FBE2D